MSETPVPVWIALAVAVVLFVWLTRRWLNWLAVAAALLLALLLAQLEPGDILIPGLPVPTPTPTRAG